MTAREDPCPQSVKQLSKSSRKSARVSFSFAPLGATTQSSLAHTARGPQHASSHAKEFRWKRWAACDRMMRLSHKLLALAGDVRTGFRALGSPNAQAKEHLLQPEAADLYECDEKEVARTKRCCRPTPRSLMTMLPCAAAVAPRWVIKGHDLIPPSQSWQNGRGVRGVQKSPSKTAPDTKRTTPKWRFGAV